MSEYHPRHGANEQPHDEHSLLPERRDDEPAVGFDREHLPTRPGIWVAEDAEAMTGQWIDATLNPDEIHAAMDGRDIYDTIGFGDFHVEPGEDPGVICQVARGIREHGPAFAFWAKLHDADPGVLASFEGSYLGEWDSPGAWARAEFQKLADRTGAGLDETVPRDWTYDEIAQQFWIEGEIVIAHTDHGTAWIFTTNP